MGELTARRAMASNAEAIATLHAESWRRSYRGLYSDAFLDSDVFEDRREVWSQRLNESGEGQFTILADLDREVVGFVHVILDHDPVWGAVVQNLHVMPDAKRQGIGTRLMAEAARALLDVSPAGGMHVWVRQDNAAARDFYRARSGRQVESTVGGPFPDGRRAPVVRYAWPEPSVLLT
jgi:ribosomal protein S18 acetylase RimI-like enzyme